MGEIDAHTCGPARVVDGLERRIAEVHADDESAVLAPAAGGENEQEHE
jgi:hypothetical protein